MNIAHFFEGLAVGTCLAQLVPGAGRKSTNTKSSGARKVVLRRMVPADKNQQLMVFLGPDDLLPPGHTSGKVGGFGRFRLGGRRNFDLWVALAASTLKTDENLILWGASAVSTLKADELLILSLGAIRRSAIVRVPDRLSILELSLTVFFLQNRVDYGF